MGEWGPLEPLVTERVLLATIARMGSPDGSYAGWAHRPAARVERQQCSASWEQDEWSFWCSLPAAHDGPHQEAGLAEECRYLVLWDDGPGHSDGEHGAGSEGPLLS